MLVLGIVWLLHRGVPVDDCISREWLENFSGRHPAIRTRLIPPPFRQPGLPTWTQWYFLYSGTVVQGCHIVTPAVRVDA